MLAHDWKKKPRSEDVRVAENARFDDFMLSSRVVAGLKKCGFRKPSPVQVLGLPVVTTGKDCLIQAKSGTGKTCVFVIAALEKINVADTRTQAVILAPTREVAVQIAQTCLWLGSAMPELKAFSFIGGMSTEDDIVKCKRCHIVVGTPGRVAWLLKNGYMDAKGVKLFVLDEADKMMDQGMRTDVVYIAKRMPKKKQVICCSATFPPEVEDLICKLMKTPEKVKVTEGDVNLVGIKQFLVKVVPHHPKENVVVKRKFTALLGVLQKQSFSQCMAFTNYQTRAEYLAAEYQAAGWPSSCLAGHLDQRTRLQALSDLQKLHCRILFATDVGARGIDVENVDLVVNFDVPVGPEWYLHRTGRAGRFGAAGLCITLVSGEAELAALSKIVAVTGSKIHELKQDFDGDLWTADMESFPMFQPLPSAERGKQMPPAKKAPLKPIRKSMKVDDKENVLPFKKNIDAGVKKIGLALKENRAQVGQKVLKRVMERADEAINSLGPDLKSHLHDRFATDEECGAIQAYLDGGKAEKTQEKLKAWLAQEKGEIKGKPIGVILKKYQEEFKPLFKTGEVEDEKVEEESSSEAEGGEFLADQPADQEDYREHAASSNWTQWFSSFMQETYALRDIVFQREYEKALSEFW